MAPDDPFPPQVLLQPGAVRVLTGPSLATAGYRWHHEVEGDAACVELTWGRQPGPGPAGVGASRPETLTIRALAPGRATLHLWQARPWEGSVPSGPTWAVDVVVAAP